MAKARSTQGTRGAPVCPPRHFWYSDNDTHGYHGAQEMAQAVKGLLDKHKDLSLIPRSCVKKARHGGLYFKSKPWGSGKGDGSLGFAGQPA